MHNLHISSEGKAAIAYAGATPWHRYGQKITDPYDINAGLQEACIDFEVETVPMYHNIDTGGLEIEPSVVPNRVVIRRTDTLVPLGTASSKYSPFQTKEAVQFLEKLLGKGKFKLEVAGALGEGERIWILVKAEEESLRIIGDDVVDKYFLVALGHDGQFNVVAMFTGIRVVCQNTLGAAIKASEAAECIKIRHTGNVQMKADIAAELLKTSGKYFNEIADSYRWLATKHIKSAALQSYLMDVCDQSVPYVDASTQIKNRIELYQKAHDTGLGSDLKGVRGTLWAAYNCVTEVVDHQLAVNNKEPIKYMGFGTGRNIKRRALELALDHAAKMN